jgi:hypothetical protein
MRSTYDVRNYDSLLPPHPHALRASTQANTETATTEQPSTTSVVEAPTNPTLTNMKEAGLDIDDLSQLSNAETIRGYVVINNYQGDL